jgi:hypothetical protein
MLRIIRHLLLMPILKTMEIIVVTAVVPVVLVVEVLVVLLPLLPIVQLTGHSHTMERLADVLPLKIKLMLPLKKCINLSLILF